MKTDSGLHSQIASRLKGASLSELQGTLKELRRMRAMRKQAGKKSAEQSGIRVELPVGADTVAVSALLKKLLHAEASIASHATDTKT